MNVPPRLWHGGVPGLRPGDVITGGMTRRHHNGCRWCEARAAQAEGGPAPAIDGLAVHQGQVYLTSDRDYARYYASLWGRGDLYLVTPVGWIESSAEDTIESWHCVSAVVRAVYDRAVLLSWSQRRALSRKWGHADEDRLRQRKEGVPPHGPARP